MRSKKKTEEEYVEEVLGIIEKCYDDYGSRRCLRVLDSVITSVHVAKNFKDLNVPDDIVFCSCGATYQKPGYCPVCGAGKKGV